MCFLLCTASSYSPVLAPFPLPTPQAATCYGVVPNRHPFWELGFKAVIHVFSEGAIAASIFYSTVTGGFAAELRASCRPSPVEPHADGDDALLDNGDDLVSENDTSDVGCTHAAPELTCA